MSSPPTRHFVFGVPGAAQLRQGLRAAGIQDEVYGLDDDLSLGPLEPYDTTTRIAFLRTVHRSPFPQSDAHDWDWLEEANPWFWDAAADQTVRRVVWYARDRAQEYCGLLEWVRRFGRQAFEVVDLCGVDIPHAKVQGPPVPGPAGSLGQLADDVVAANALWRHARPLTTHERSGFTRTARRILAENGNVRLVHRRRLHSWPVTVVDDVILQSASEVWQASPVIAAQTLIAFWPIGHIGALLPFGRINFLIDEGRLETRATEEGWRPLVRLPLRAQPMENDI